MLWNVTTLEFLNTGHMACPGCGAAMSMRHALKALGEDTIVIIPACCWSIIAGTFPTTALSVPLLHVPFATAASCATGVRRALIAQGKKEVNVMVWAGDGGTFDIGLQALSGAADRREDFLYVCYDNEAYMNTGVQQSSATPPGAWSTTTPGGKDFLYEKKDIINIIRSHKPAYIATGTISYPQDFYNKFQKAKAIKGFRFIHLLCACPAGWKIDSQDALKVTRMAVESGVFPLMELKNGENNMRITYHPRNPISVEDYLRSQKRFRNLKKQDVELLTSQVEERKKEIASTQFS